MNEQEFLGELSELTFWTYSAGHKVASRRTNVISVGRVFGIDFWHLDAVQGQHTALVAATVPWVGYETALDILQSILLQEGAGRSTNTGLWKFGKFWESIDYWPGVVRSTEDRIQYGTTVRDDPQAADDYRYAFFLSERGVSERLLFAALRHPGMLSENYARLVGVPDEYAAEALGLEL